MKSLVITSQLSCPNSYTNDFPRYGNRAIGQDNLITNVQLAFKENKEAIDDVLYKTLCSHTDSHPSNPCTCKQARDR